jgi:hypothetical protein
MQIIIDEMKHLSERMFAVRGSYRFSKSALENIPLRALDKEFLTSPGLPCEEVLSVSFQPDQYGLRPFHDDDFEPPTLMPSSGKWIVVGGNIAVLICANVDEDGVVWSLIRTKYGMNSFVNTSLHQLIGCLAAYVEMFTTGDPNAGPSEDRRLFEAFKGRLKTFDSACLIDPDSYWSAVVDEIEYEIEA